MHMPISKKTETSQLQTNYGHSSWPLRTILQSFSHSYQSYQESTAPPGIPHHSQRSPQQHQHPSNRWMDHNISRGHISLPSSHPQKKSPDCHHRVPWCMAALGGSQTNCKADSAPAHDEAVMSSVYCDILGWEVVYPIKRTELSLYITADSGFLHIFCHKHPLCFAIDIH